MSDYGGQQGDTRRKLGDRQRKFGRVAVLLSLASMAFAFAQGVLGELAALILGPPWLAGLAGAFLVLALVLALAAVVVTLRRPNPDTPPNPDPGQGIPKPGISRRMWRHLRWWLPAVALIVVLAYAVPPIWSWAEIEVSGCSQPTELRVMTSPDLLEPYQRVADAYEQWTADRHHDCPTANLYVYPVPTDHAIDALGRGWVPEDPDSDGIGEAIDWPRPDVWLADSRLDVERLGGDLPHVEIEHLTIALTPLVVAFFGPESASPAPEDNGWAGWWSWLEERGWGPLRPDPAVSVTGRLANAAIYLSQDVITYDGEGEPRGNQRRAAALERGLISSLADGDVKELRGADETAVLCELVWTPATTVAVVLSEQTIQRHRQGRLSDGACAAGRRGTPVGEDVDLVSFQPDGRLRIRREFAMLDWDDAANPQERVAERFRAWLTSDEADAGQAELRRVGLEAPTGDLTAPWLELPLGTDGTDNEIAPLRRVVAEAQDLYQDVRRPGRVLVLLDLSGSMDEVAGGPAGGPTTFTLASNGVRETVDLMSDKDQFILWGFPGLGEQVSRPLLTLTDTEGWGDLSPDQRQNQVAAALSGVDPDGGTPLFEALTRAVEEVGPDDNERISAVVVLTDGEDSGEALLDDVVDEVDDSDVRIYAVAVGNADCVSSGLETLTAETGGACQETGANDIEEVLRNMLGALWGGNGEGR